MIELALEIANGVSLKIDLFPGLFELDLVVGQPLVRGFLQACVLGLKLGGIGFELVEFVLELALGFGQLVHELGFHRRLLRYQFVVRLFELRNHCCRRRWMPRSVHVVVVAAAAAAAARRNG